MEERGQCHIASTNHLPKIHGFRYLVCFYTWLLVVCCCILSPSLVLGNQRNVRDSIWRRLPSHAYLHDNILPLRRYICKSTPFKRASDIWFQTDHKIRILRANNDHKFRLDVHRWGLFTTLEVGTGHAMWYVVFSHYYLRPSTPQISYIRSDTNVSINRHSPLSSLPLPPLSDQWLSISTVMNGPCARTSIAAKH